MSIFLGALAAIFTVAYWVFCRHSALAHQSHLGELMVAYFDREDVSEASKDSAYWAYNLSRTWFFMPIMAVLSVAAFFFAIVTARLDSDMSKIKTDTARNDIMDAALKMYMAKNPITFIVFMTASLVIISVMLPFGFIFNRLKSVPSPTSIYSLIANKASHFVGRHAH